MIGAIETEQGWDDSSRLTGRTDDAGNTTGYVYDPLDRVERLVYADGTERLYGWDPHDNLTAWSDANGNAVALAYDLLNRLTGKTIARGPGVLGTTWESYAWDGLSRLVRAEDDDSAAGFAYDSLSNVTREEQNGRAVASTHDGVGNRLTLAYPGGRAIATAYDALDRIATISEAGAALAAYRYAGPWRVERREYPKADPAATTWMEYAWDGARRVVGTRHAVDPMGADAALDERSYAWDGMYNKTAMSDLLPGGASRTFAYDSIYRMTASTGGPEGDVGYALDGVGNRTSVAGSGPEAGVYAMSAAAPEPADAPMNQYTATPAGPRSYDANGNLVEKSGPNGDDTYLAYDYRNQLVQYENAAASGYIVELAYDALGRRIERRVEDQVEEFVYDGWRVIEERGEAGTVAASYVYGRYVDEVLTMRRSGSDYFYHSDEQFNVVAASNAQGEVVERYVYGDYGAPTMVGASGQALAASAIGNPYLYNGRRWDGAWGLELYYYRTRYLDPVAGRFITRDAIGIWGDAGNIGNGYAYVGNNPWTWVDPWGLNPSCPADGSQGPHGDPYLDELQRQRDDALEETYEFLREEGTDYAKDVAKEGAKYAAEAIILKGAGRFFRPVKRWFRKIFRRTPKGPLPDEVFSGKAPRQRTPTGRPETYKHERYNPRTGKGEESRVHYDRHGRQTGRTDYTDHGRPQNHDNPHHHKTDYGPGYGSGRGSEPLPGPYPGDPMEP